MSKKRIITSRKNLTPDLLELFNAKFGEDKWENLIKVETGKTPFYAVLFETKDTDYLVKVDVKSDDDINSLKELLEPNLHEPKNEEENIIPDIEDVAEYEE